MKPDKYEFRVGETKHQQTVRLVGERVGGVLTWTIHKKASSQRDQDDSISGLPAEVIIKMAEAVKGAT